MCHPYLVQIILRSGCTRNPLSSSLFLPWKKKSLISLLHSVATVSCFIMAGMVKAVSPSVPSQTNFLLYVGKTPHWGKSPAEVLSFLQLMIRQLWLHNSAAFQIPLRQMQRERERGTQLSSDVFHFPCHFIKPEDRILQKGYQRTELPFCSTAHCLLLGFTKLLL